MMRRSKYVLSLLTTLLSLVVPVAVQPEGAAAGPPAASIANRYQDGLDSRFAAERFAQSTAALGYGSSSYTGGRSASDAWGDGLQSAVFGFFGHSNAGLAQVREGSTDPADEFLAAGLDGDVGAGNLYFWSEYLPFIDVDDMKLAIFGGCYTGYSSQDWGSFGSVGREKGVDSVVGFRGLVYYPADCTSCNYSGNYFWDRFSVYAQAGDTVGTALSKANSDLVAKEGASGGWDKWYVQGAVTSPSSVRLTPAASGEPLNSKPFGIDPFDPLALAVTALRTTVVDGRTFTDYETADGVSYRRDPITSALTWLSAPASTQGNVTKSHEDAKAVATDFVRRHALWLGDVSVLRENGPATHTPGDALAAFSWRMSSENISGPGQVTVEVDKRTGSIVNFTAAQQTPATVGFEIDQDQAVSAATAVLGKNGILSANADLWNGPRWIVTVDRGLRDGTFPDVARAVVDGRSGQVLSLTKT